MHPEEERLFIGKPNLTVEASTAPDSLTNKSTGSPKKPRWWPLVLIVLTLLLIVSGIAGIGIYQNNVNETNAHNAYLSSLSICHLAIVPLSILDWGSLIRLLSELLAVL